MDPRYPQIAERIASSRYVIALTGAGISVESGIPDFRSEDGLWSRYDPMEYGHIESFRMNPAKVWRMLLEMDLLLSRANPNSAHYALARMESSGYLKEIITQNVDSLHQRAGSVRVIEFHGNGRELRCDGCGRSFDRGALTLETVPPVCPCGGSLRPNFVFFGEMIPPSVLEEARLAARSCDMMLIVGTSATVAPASHLPHLAKQNRAFIVEVNPMPTMLSSALVDIQLAESAGKALTAILSELERRDSGKRTEYNGE